MSYVAHTNNNALPCPGAAAAGHRSVGYLSFSRFCSLTCKHQKNVEYFYFISFPHLMYLFISFYLFYLIIY